jgi:predicted NBD/HSP70 family sugar kinase
MAGVVDSAQGSSRYQPYFDWHDVQLGNMLETKLGVLTIIDNDVNTLTMSEKLYGAGRGVSDFLTITIGRGIGLGIVADGKLYRGSRGGGGEFGHMVIDETGPMCDCGKRGCLESLVSEPAMLEEAQLRAGSGEIRSVSSIDDLIDIAKEGDPTACSIFERAGEILGRGIANLITLLNPSLIVISGEGVRMGELLFKPMRKSIEEHTMPTLVEDTDIRIDLWGEDEWAIGAASLVLGEVFRSPVVRAIPSMTYETRA